MADNYKNIKEIEKNYCYACRSCEQICPAGCIYFTEDREGFIFPMVDDSSCMNCGLCLNHCPVFEKGRHDFFHKEYYAVQLKDRDMLAMSSSGGASFGLSDYIISKGGYIFGCTFDNNFKAVMKCADNRKTLKKFQGSKYVFSDTLKTFSEVKNILDSNKSPVIYTGRPCQIAGLKSFLNKDYENLFTVDLICHGVPSGVFFTKYIKWQEAKNSEKIIYYGFRDKDVGGWSCNGKIKTKTKTKTKTLECFSDPYYASFLRNEDYRECCYSCRYASLNRPGDITVGDFWGVNEFYPNVNYKQGISCMIINSNKGKVLFEETKNRFYFFTISEIECTAFQNNLKAPSVRPKRRNDFYNGIYKDFNLFIKRIKTTHIFKIKVKKFIKTILPYCIIKSVQNFLRRRQQYE